MAKTARSVKARLLDDHWSYPIPLRTDLDSVKRGEFEASWLKLKLILLAEHFDIAIGPDWGHALALRLAVEFVEGFAVQGTAPSIRTRGRPRGAQKIDGWELFRVIELMRTEQGKNFRLKSACERLSRPPSMEKNRQFKGHKPTVLRATYHAKKSQLRKIIERHERLVSSQK